jgi:hypothetical protein
MFKKHRKKCAPIKWHRKKEKKACPPSKIKARGESQSEDYLEKQKIYSRHLHISIKLHD